MSLIGSLGLDAVEADPNYLADGAYPGEVFKSEYVIREKDGEETVNHVITYRVTEGDRKGAQKAEWFRLGKDPVREGPANELVGMTPTMTEQAKTWYKKRLVDLGIPEEEIATLVPQTLVGIPVDFGVKTKNGYTNVSFVSRREIPGVAGTAPVAPSGPAGAL